MIHLFTFIILTFLGALMLFQDVRHRAISWVLFPIFFAVVLFWAWQDAQLWLLSTLINVTFLALNMLLVLIWFGIKKVSPKQLLREYVGIGDFLLFIVLAFSLPYYLFLPFQILSLVISMCLGMSVFKGKTVPLAGIQAALLVFLLGSITALQIPIWKLEHLFI